MLYQELAAPTCLGIEGIKSQQEVSLCDWKGSRNLGNTRTLSAEAWYEAERARISRH